MFVFGYWYKEKVNSCLAKNIGCPDWVNLRRPPTRSSRVNEWLDFLVFLENENKTFAFPTLSCATTAPCQPHIDTHTGVMSGRHKQQLVHLHFCNLHPLVLTAQSSNRPGILIPMLILFSGCGKCVCISGVNCKNTSSFVAITNNMV